jgi:hypothetical protein
VLVGHLEVRALVGVEDLLVEYDEVAAGAWGLRGSTLVTTSLSAGGAVDAPRG